MMEKCWYCGMEKEEQDLEIRTVRTGISRRYFPQFSYEDVMLCSRCQEKHVKKEKTARIGAYAGLVIIFALMFWGFYMIFATLYLQ